MTASFYTEAGSEVFSLTPVLSRWERGRDRPSLDDPARLARGRGGPVAPSPSGRGPG